MPKKGRIGDRHKVKLRHELVAVFVASLTVLVFINYAHPRGLPKQGVPSVGRAAGGRACVDVGGSAGCHTICEDLFSKSVPAGDAYCQDTYPGRYGRCCAMIDLISCSSHAGTDAWCMDSCSGDFGVHAPEGDAACPGKLCCSKEQTCEEAGGTAGCRDDCREGSYPVHIAGGDSYCLAMWDGNFPFCCAYS